jgi:putative ABC transport system permease protein
MYLFKLAMRNAFRKPRRTILTSITVVVGVFMIVLGWALLGALDNSVTRGQIRSDTGHFRVMAAGHLEAEEEQELGPLVENWSPLAERVSQESGAKVHPRITFYGELSNGTLGLKARGIGVQPESYFSSFDLSVEKASMPQTGEDALPPIWLGAGLAEPFGLAAGDTVTVLTRTQHGAYTADEYMIAGIVRSQNAAIDSTTFFIPLDNAQSLLDAPGAVTELVGFLSSASDASGVSARLGPTLSAQGAIVQTWQERAAPVLKINEARRRGLSALIFLIMLVAATGIANTIIMSCFERIREIGTLRALGFQTEAVAGLFLAEALVIGLLGSLAGMLLADAVVYSLRDGIDFSKMAASSGVVISMSTRLYPEPSVPQSITALLIGLVVTVGAALYPSLKFSRLSAVEAMRR